MQVGARQTRRKLSDIHSLLQQPLSQWNTCPVALKEDFFAKYVYLRGNLSARLRPINQFMRALVRGAKEVKFNFRLRQPERGK